MSLSLQVENLGKRYRLGVINRGMLYKDLQSWWAKVLRREDPNSPVHAARSGSGAAGQAFWAFRDVNFSVNQGEILGIIGRNGAGKSTLLKVLSQITAPTEGQCKLNGRVASLLEVGTGFHGELTGRENIFLDGAILGMSRAEVRACFDRIVEFAEVAQFVDTPVKRYSSGMYVRLAFSVAAHLQPDILIVDEVLAVGDAAFQKKCLGRMDEAAYKEGRTILFVSHNMTSVRNLCTRAILLKNGRLEKDGPASEIVDSYLGEGYSTYAGIYFRDLPAEGSFAFRWPSVDLVPGHYNLVIRIVANGDHHTGELLDMPPAMTFSVGAADYYGSGRNTGLQFGTVLVRGDWTMQTSA